MKFAALLVLAASCAAEETRTWTDRAGRTFTAQIVACDARRVTLNILSGEQWNAEVTAQRAYDHYNSAALLTHYFLRHDGRGDSVGVAAYLDAIRRGTSPADAEARHLLRGRTREQLRVELQKLARRLALDTRMD